ncbi:MAG TPA: GntR family transcriptional regulator [Treponemataceae bacterium]|nr:GntR family transcriptional regulator [Treponemataceae bacterium]
MDNFDANIPIYVQIIQNIKEKIVTGSLVPGDKLPSVREHSESLSVNPNTVQRSYQELEREGVTETRRGLGTYIVEKDGLIEQLKAEMAEMLLKQFIDGMHSLGFKDDIIPSILHKALQGGNQ